MSSSADPAVRSEPRAPAAAPIFALSFRHRDELAGMIERAGWTVIAARRPDAAERRFIASGATIAVIDARGALEEGLAALALLADPVQSNASALLVLLSKPDIASLDAVFAEGATHYLASPFGEREFTQMLRFANRHAERLAGGNRAASERAALLAAEAETWRWPIGASGVTLSPHLAQRLGATAGEEAAARTLLKGLDGEGRVAALSAVRRLRETGLPTAFAHVGKAGSGRVAHHIRWEEGQAAILGWIEDVDGRRSTRSGSRDPLTGLDDSQGARRWIAAHLDDTESSCVVMMVAAGRFDAVNASHGRATGDALLQGIARRIERMVAESGPRGEHSPRMIARMAGAEFVIGLAAPATVEDATFLADRLAETVARPFMLADQLITLDCRIGIAAAEPGDSDPALLLRRASAALAEAKAGEGGSVRVLDARGEAASAAEDRLGIDLREALEKDEIELLFQPQVDVTTGRIAGVEALARWRHPRLGELGAVPLFATAERSDFLQPLSAHVQRKAIQAAAAWPEALAGLRVAVNVTAADIAKPDFADAFLAMVDEIGFDHARLTVEVTESGLIEDLSAAARLLAALRAKGLRVAIDDFGTGYSSLAYLKALPLDYLKIDKRLSDDITGSARDRVVVRGVIEMARSLGLAVIAEGVESEEQLSLLAREGCNYYQGFLCSPPVGVEELVRLVRRHSA